MDDEKPQGQFDFLRVVYISPSCGRVEYRYATLAGKKKALARFKKNGIVILEGDDGDGEKTI